MPKVLIVGGGPVGLYLAYEINRLDKNAEITIAEKRPTYDRKQIVVLHHRNIQRLPRSLKSTLFGQYGKGCYVKPPPFDQMSTCYTSHRGGLLLGSIALKYLERGLSDYIGR